MLNNKINLFLFSLILFIILFFEQNITYILLGIIALAIVYQLGKKSILSLIIIAELILTGNVLEKYRPYITLVSLLLLLYFFLSDYGLKLDLYPKIPRPLLYLILFILLTVFISSIFSIDIWTSLTASFHFLVFFLLCYLLYSQIKDRTVIYYYLLSFFISVIILGYSMILEFTQKGLSFYHESAVYRVAGIYENPNYVGLLLVITIPLTLAFIMLLTKQRKSILVFLFFFLCFQILLLILADSRASALSILISSIIVFYFSSTKNKLISISVLSLIVIPLLLFSDIVEIVEIYLRLDRVGTREMFWESGIEIISNNYLTGVGADTFDKVFYSFAPSTITDLYKSGTWYVGKPHPHNLLLYFWAENGILGLLTFISFFYFFFSVIYKTLRIHSQISGFDKILVITILSIGVGIFFRSFFEVTGVLTYGFITRDLPFWIIFILLTYIYQYYNNISKKRIL